jgi:hypothetical protein
MSVELIALTINYGPFFLGAVLCLLLIKFITWIFIRNEPNHKVEVVQHESGHALYINGVRVAGEHPTYVTKTIANFEVTPVNLKMGVENVK